VLGGPSISRQYREFTSLSVNQNASVRFVDASGFRADLWRVALDEFRSHPLGGLGAGNYDTEYYRLRHNPEYVVQPHSLELQMAAELGVGGIVALVLFCGGVLYAGVVRRGTIASRDRFIKVAALGMFAAWLAATSVDWLYDIPGLAGMAVVAAGLLVVRTAPDVEAGGRNRTRRGALVVGLGVLALLAASMSRAATPRAPPQRSPGLRRPRSRRSRRPCALIRIRSAPCTRSRVCTRASTTTAMLAQPCWRQHVANRTTTSLPRCSVTSPRGEATAGRQRPSIAAPFS
jgi:hypothetical protein